MAKIIQAKAVLSAEDRGASAVFDKLAKKIDQVGKAGKAAEAVDRMAKSLERAKMQMAAIDRFNASRGGFADARARYQATQAAVTQAAAAMKRGEGDARQLARSYERAQAAASSAGRAFERQKSALIANKRAMEQLGVPVNQAARYQERLRAEVDRTTAAIRRQEVASERSHNRRVAIAGAAAYAGHLAAHGVRHGARETLHTYREFDKERRFSKAVMGLTDEQQAPMVQQAIHMGATTKFNDIQVLEAQRELAARGLKSDQVMGLMQPAGNLGMALDLRLPEAVKQMEGAIFGFKKDISTLNAAMASAKRTADVQVKAAKISGMTPEDITQAYKYGATPARLSGVSEETLLAFAGISKKANMGGDESGVAFRALMAAAQSPTRKAREALLANGLNYKNYQNNPDRLALAPFVENVAAQYGVKLNKRAQAGLGRVFEDKALISDPAKFTPAVLDVLGKTLGGSDAKSKRSIAGMANRFRASSMEGIDVNAFIADLMTKIPGNLQLANAIFGSKQGGRIATALGDPETFKKMIGELVGGSEGYAQRIADERMAGFDGAVSRFEGAIKNLETAIGRGFDADGKGGLLTSITDFLGKGTQWFAEQNPKLVAGGATAVGAAGLGLAGFTAWKFLNILTTGGGLTASAVALDSSAAALTAAAVKLGGGSIAGTAASAAGGSAAAAGIWGKIGRPLLMGGSAVAGAAALGFLGYEAYQNFPTLTPEGEKKRIDQQGREEYARRQRARGMFFSSEIGNRNLDQRLMGSPELTRTMTYGTGVGGQLNATLTGSAEVHGQAEVKVTVEAGSTLLQVVEQSKRLNMDLRGSVNANGPGSAGKSSPDAAAPATGASGAW